MSSWKIFPIGFHIGPGGNATGLNDDFMAPLDAAGIRFCLKSVDAYPLDAVLLAEASGIPHTIIWRPSGIDVPNYNLDPLPAAQEHFQKYLAKLPPEFNKKIVWAEAINEVDKGRASWLGYFGIEWTKLALSYGIEKVMMFGWSSGEPEPEHWLLPGMSDFLVFASQNRANVGVSLHEYSYEVSDIYRWYPWLIGRYRFLFDACDQLGIPRVTVAITEWGWTLDSVPPAAPAMDDINAIALEYVQHPEIIGAGLWYLGPGFDGIADRAQPLIKPTGDLALNWPNYIEHPWPLDSGTEPPPTGDCDFDDAFTKYHILRPSSLIESQKEFIWDLMDNGVDRSVLGLFGDGKVHVGYEGWSHVDALLAIRRAIEAGFIDSRLIIVDGHWIGTGLDMNWILENCPVIAPYTVFLTSEGAEPEPFGFDVWPTNYEYITQEFGANPQNYEPFGLPGHDGVDIRGPEGSPIYSVAGGIIYRIETNPDVHNYGIHVRVLHRDGWKTIYAHFLEVASGLAVGQAVHAGQILGLADNTGNSFGSHLHLGLKREGYTYTDPAGNVWPYNLFDPTPFLKQLCPPCFEPEPPPPVGQSKLGLHASADPGLAAGEAGAFSTAKVDLVKVLSTLPPDDVTALAYAATLGAPFVVRAFLSFGGRNVSPQEFFDWTVSDVRRTIDRLKDREVLIELHNEPNLVQEGWTTSWNNGFEFGTWVGQVLGLYKQAFPALKFVFPGLSPGGAVNGIRYNSVDFLSEASNVMSNFDFLGVHAYWAANWPMELAVATVDEALNMYQDMNVVVTEASNNRRDTSQDAKALEYIEFNNRLRSRARVYGVTYFISSASNEAWGWSVGTGEVWVGTNIPAIVGSR